MAIVDMRGFRRFGADFGNAQGAGKNVDEAAS
jgi:hypothetical protein